MKYGLLLLSLLLVSCSIPVESEQTSHKDEVDKAEPTDVIYYGRINRHDVFEFKLIDGTRCVITDGASSGNVVCDFK